MPNSQGLRRRRHPTAKLSRVAGVTWVCILQLCNVSELSRSNFGSLAYFYFLMKIGGERKN